MTKVFDTAARRLKYIAKGRLVAFIDFDTLSVSVITKYYPKYINIYLSLLEEKF